MLACYIYPIPKGTEYTETDLRNPNKVVELFGYCGILEGSITKAGWRFLVEEMDMKDFTKWIKRLFGMIVKLLMNILIG